MRSRALVLCLLLLAAAPLFAQQALEIIPLRHATVEQVLPALRPLLEQGGTLTGQSGQLFVRTSPQNLAELRQALEAIDRAPRRLMISVRFDDAMQDSREAFGASGRAGGGRTDIELRARGREARSEERVDQQLQVMEGGRATIYTGQTRAVPQRQLIQTPAGVIAQETFVVQEAASGFQVVPRLSGERVFLEIAPQRESFGDSPVPGSIQSRRLATSTSGPLGEWFEIGGLAASAARDERGLASASRSASSESRRVWVKVEELR
jgi:hypothetical protein